MAKKSKRKRKQLRRRKTLDNAVHMELVQDAPGVQKCPKCHTTIKDHFIKSRICYRCSPKAADVQMKANSKPSEKVDIPTQNHINAEYDSKETALRASCRANGIPVPEEFENWRIYFFSRGSALREWMRMMPIWIKGHTRTKPTTDMTPSHQLEAKIRARREATGTTGPGFKTVEQKVANLRGLPTPWQQKANPTPMKAAPVIPAPNGEEGKEFVVI